MPNPVRPRFVSPHLRPPVRRRDLGIRILLFAVALSFAFCVSARAAVVEADEVERQVDTPTGIQVQKGLDEPAATPPPVEAPVTGPGGSTAGPGATVPSPGTVGDPGQPASDPVTTATSTTQGSQGGGMMGPVIVGLLIVLIGGGLVIFLARGRR